MKNLLLALLLGSTTWATAQTRPVSHAGYSARHTSVLTEEEESALVRNHGTGLHVGSVWAQTRGAFRGQGWPAALEVGAFHQRALSEVISVQGEALYYREMTAGGRSSGVRVPALLVLNPFDNVSVHFGPQLQVRTGGTGGRLATAAVAAEGVPLAWEPRLTTKLVIGGEARVGFLRVGLRYALPFAQLNDFKETGQQIGRAWQSGQVQVYLSGGL